MKLPKFMKTSSKDKQPGGRQLLITELQFQPHKNAAAIMNFDKSLYMTPKGLNNMTPKFGENSRPSVAAGRYVKSAQTKRLQRTPKCYVGAAKTNNQITTPVSYFTRSSGVSEADKKANTLRPIDNLTGHPGRQLDLGVDKPADVTDSAPLKDNLTTPSKLDTALVETPAPTNRFSFSKLTKFVSKSALRVVSRKLSSSPMSLNSSASSSSISISSPGNVGQDEDAHKKAPNLPLPPVPAPKQLERPPQPDYQEEESSVYKSEEQRAEIEKRVARLVDEYRSHRSSCGNSNSAYNRVPNMGVTSVMLRELRKKQEGSSTTIGVFPIACLITAPHVFQSSSSSSPPSTAKISDQVRSPDPSTYDRLARTPFLGDDAPSTTKKNPSSRLIVKSLSSIVPESPVNAPAATPSTCRISIFSSKKAIICQSAARLTQPFESFSETVF